MQLFNSPSPSKPPRTADMALDVSTWQIATTTIDGVTRFHYVNHDRALMTTGFGTAEILATYSGCFRGDPAALPMLAERYQREYP